MASIAPESAAQAAPGTPGLSFSPAGEKYDLVGEIGAGGMGEVVLVHDRDLRREVAMKLIRAEFADDATIQRKFVAEAQATSQLEHPGIPPVHDIGITPEGKLYFTMKVVRGKTLGQLLKELFLGARETRATWNLHKLASVLERVAEALHFAHEKDVLHRDLKPENVMLGEFGEVHVMDWGIAKVGTARGDDTDHADVVHTLETDHALMTQVGTVKGTIPYMSPEQARGEPLDRRSDVYALGAILYEMLTLSPAFSGGGVQLVLKVRNGEFTPVETRNPRRPVPEALVLLCKRAMAKDPADRPATAHEFGDALRAWLDGRAESERRHREAEALAAQGREAMARYVASHGAIDVAERTAAEVATQFKPWQPASETRPVREARRVVEDAMKDAALAFAHTTRLLDAALVAEPENASARAAFSDLWRGRLDDAERRGDRVDTAHALTMVRRYDDGRLAAYLAGRGSLSLTSDPPGAEVALIRFEDDLGILVAGAERSVGSTPLAGVPLPMGSYLAILRKPGFPDVRYPVHVSRNRVWQGHVKFRTQMEIGEGFVYVPGGPLVYGDGNDTRVLELPDFAISRSGVTFGDWAEFLAAVEATEGLAAATKLVPSLSGDNSLMRRTDAGAWRPSPRLVEGAAREWCLREHGEGFDERIPVLGVSSQEAVAYCAWKTSTTGREWRLPTEVEREKAARGVDGRRFPWGDLESASLCKCAESRAAPTQPEPGGAFPTATSVYGMMDAAGGVWEWTSSPYDPHRAGAEHVVIRGGGWTDSVGATRCAFRGRVGPNLRSEFIGFRPARSLSPQRAAPYACEKNSRTASATSRI